MTNDAAMGAILGALVGDAAGAVLEFFRNSITAEDVRWAMTMPGGGTWKVAPGQITDDGELTMSLLQALVDNRDDLTEAAASRYACWVASDPFDIGATTRAGLGAARGLTQDLARVMTAAAQERNMKSKANGSLMRATPLAVWGARQEIGRVVEATMADARLSHPNPACVGAAVAYVLAIRHLLREPGDVEGAFAQAETAALSFEEPRAWLAEARAGVRVPYTPMDGFVRIAFTHAFRHLRAGTSYEDAIAETLLGGGDTDTNACIVGGLLGARWGASGIPLAMRTAVLEADLEKGAHRRPAELHPSAVPALLTDLLVCAD